MLCSKSRSRWLVAERMDPLVCVCTCDVCGDVPPCQPVSGSSARSAGFRFDLFYLVFSGNQPPSTSVRLWKTATSFRVYAAGRTSGNLKHLSASLWRQRTLVFDSVSPGHTFMFHLSNQRRAHVGDSAISAADLGRQVRFLENRTWSFFVRDSGLWPTPAPARPGTGVTLFPF